MTELKAPEIKTERLILRVLTLTDAPAMYSYRSAPEVMRHQAWHPANEKEIQAFIQITQIQVSGESCVNIYVFPFKYY